MTDLPADWFNRPLADVDPEVAEVLRGELERQQATLEMIASENFVPQAVLDCQGSVLTNKYAEGLPGKRYYGGCEWVDVAEQLAIDRAKALFGAGYANVQPHSGAQANAAAYFALLEPGDKVLGLDLAHGGHLTHGMPKNVSGRLYDVVAYHVRREDSLVDMDEVARLAAQHRPKLIIAGWSAYPRQLDFARFREIADEVGAILLTDMAHFAGLVAAELHPNPVPHSHVVTTTIHKTLGGARGGMILSNDEEIARKLNSAVFPGQQGGPLEHVIAGKAVALGIAATEAFRERQRRTIEGARAVGRGAARRRPRRQRAHRWHGRAPGGRRPARVRAGRQAGRGPPARRGHHREPQRRAVRPAPADGVERAARRRAGTRHPRAVRGGLPRGRPHHGHRADARVRRRPRRAGRARRGDRRAPSAVRAPGRARARLTRARLRRAAPSAPPQLPCFRRPMNELDALYAFLVAAAVAGLLTPLVARLATRVGAVNRPSGRGLSAGETPLLGGLAILAGVLAAGALFLPGDDQTRAILGGAATITAVGAVDDAIDLPPAVKLVGQIAAALIPVLADVKVSVITLPFLGHIDLGNAGGVLTVIGLVAVMNIVNFSDGIDGLAAGVCTISAAAFAIIAFDLQREAAGVLAALTAGAALGFLFWNFHPASVFMGDSGSNLLGLLLGCIAVQGTLKTNALIALVGPLAILAVPFLDGGFVVAKRLKYRRRPWMADDEHFHHRLSRIGFSQRRTVLYLYALDVRARRPRRRPALHPVLRSPRAPERGLDARRDRARPAGGGGQRVPGLRAGDPQVHAPPRRRAPGAGPGDLRARDRRRARARARDRGVRRRPPAPRATRPRAGAPARVEAAPQEPAVTPAPYSAPTQTRTMPVMNAASPGSSPATMRW